MKKTFICFLSALIILFSSCSQNKPQISAKDKNKIDSVYAKLGVLYDSILSFDSNESIELKNMCTAKSLGIDSIKDIGVFKVDELEKYKFAKDSSAFYKTSSKNMDEKWRWLSTARYLLEEDFGKLPTDMNGKELDRALWSIKKKSWFLGDKIIAVLVKKEGNMPEIIDDYTYKGGYFYGKLFLVNASDYSLLCATEIEVQSSDELTFKKYRGKLKIFNKDEDNVLLKDFKEAFKTKLWDTMYGFDPNFGGF